MLRHKKFLKKISGQRVKYKRAIKTYSIKRIVVAVFAVLAFSYLVAGDYGFYKIGKLYFKRKALNRKLAAEKARNDSLKLLIKKANRDSVFMDRIAREKLGMAKEGETVYKFLKKQ